MKIAIDVQTIGRQRGGDETYYKNLLKEYSAQNGDDSFSLFYTSSQAEPFLNSLGSQFAPRKLSCASPWLRIPFSAPWELFREKVDVYHTQYVGVSVPSVKLVLTVHDLSYEIYPSSFSRNRAFFLKGTRWSAQAADRVIAVSQSTKKDLMKFYSIGEEKISVIYNGVDERYHPQLRSDVIARVCERYQLNKPYVLAVGSPHPRKNMERLIDAFYSVKQTEGAELQLVIAGTLNSAASKMIENRSDVRVLGYVPDEDLPALYGSAICFVYPSLYEGFGLPVIEAMACGVPVVCSNTSSLPEITNGAALLFSPLEAENIAQALKIMISDKEKRRYFSEKGLAQSKKFSWAKAARETRAVYHSVMEEVLV